MPRLLTLFFFFSITLLRAQSLSFCGNCSWDSEGFQSIWEQYISEDTAMSRMKVSSVRIAVTKDTLSAGFAMRNMNDPNCFDCRLVRFDAMGRKEFVFTNTPSAMSGKLLKTQYIYDEQSRPKYVLQYMKSPMNEEDTAYHMYQFELYSYYKNFSISKTYSPEGTGFSATPRQPALSITTRTYDDKGRVLCRKTNYPSFASQNDSTVFRYGADGSVSYDVYAGKQLVYSSRATGEFNRPAEMHDTTFTGPQSTVAYYYTYDTEQRLIRVLAQGDEQLQRICGGVTSTEIRYDKNGLPLLIVFRGRGDYCALAFYYSYY